MSAAPKVIQQITNAPLPLMLEQLGMSIANAQAALDANSIRLANEMATVTVNIGDEEYNLISLGFAPTFYAFTEASFEAKMEFSIAESESFGGSLGLSYGNVNSNTTGGNSNNNSGNTNGNNNSGGNKTKTQMFGISMSAHYSRKFSVSAEASSSIAAKIVSLPAPDAYFEILKSTINKD